MLGSILLVLDIKKTNYFFDKTKRKCLLKNYKHV
jgi:hypothetical protein